VLTTFAKPATLAIHVGTPVIATATFAALARVQVVQLQNHADVMTIAKTDDDLATFAGNYSDPCEDASDCNSGICSGGECPWCNRRPLWNG
jgi:hypothetical protein